MEFWHLTEIDGPILVDANVLLNAVFVPEGLCASAIDQLGAAQKVLAIEEITWRECERKIRQF
jgi:predicted nucleic acid-binding protein